MAFWESFNLNISLLQDDSDDSLSPPDKRSGLQGIPWRDFSRGGFSLGKEHSSMGKISEKNTSGKQGDKSEPVRKSKRVPKRRVLDGAFDDDEDDEIRYLEKLKTSKVAAGHKDDEEESGKKQRRVSKMRTIDGNLGSGNDCKRKSRSDRVSEDTDYEEEQEDEVISDCEHEESKRKKPRKESVDSLMETKREMTLTTRQRALQSSKDASSSPGASLIEFPNGLPPAPSRSETSYSNVLRVLIWSFYLTSSLL